MYLEKLCSAYFVISLGLLAAHAGQSAATALTLAAHRWANAIAIHAAWINAS